MTTGLVQTEQTLFFSSSEALGAQNIDLDGSRFQVRLDAPISVPPGAVDVTIECVAANIWFVSPNISEEIGNNKLYMSYNLLNIPVFTLPDGLYGADSLNLTIKRWLKSQGIPGGSGRFGEDAIKITADIATQKLVFENLTATNK